MNENHQYHITEKHPPVGAAVTVALVVPKQEYTSARATGKARGYAIMTADHLLS